MSELSKQILDIGRQISDGSIPEGDVDKVVAEFQKAHHLSRKQLKKIMRPEISKLQSEANAKQREADRLKGELEKTQYAGALIDALKSDDENGVPPTGETVRRFREMFPEVWNDTAQRIYKHVDSYGNYQLAYLEWGWARVLKSWYDEDGRVPTGQHQDTLDIFEIHKEHNFPFFFVSRGICDAAWQSDLKFAVDWKSMHLPYEAFTFVLPRNNPIGYDSITVYRRVNDGDIRLTMVGHGKTPLGKEIIVEFPFEVGIPTAESDAIRWTFNTIYAMSARPEYVEGGERVGTHKTTRSEIWTPNVIGRKYAIKSHSFANQSGGSVRLHWRRGHFRQQPFGIGRTQHKVIWIEPMMVGGKSDVGIPTS